MIEKALHFVTKDNVLIKGTHFEVKTTNSTIIMNNASIFLISRIIQTLLTRWIKGPIKVSWGYLILLSGVKLKIVYKEHISFYVNYSGFLL